MDPSSITTNNTSSSSASSQPVPIVWVNRVEYVCCFLLQLGALVLLSLPLFAHFFRRKWLSIKDGIAETLLVYLFASISFAAPSLVYNVYMLRTWLLSAASFDPFWMFWTGLWSQAGISAISNAMLFLTLDRCLTLKWPTNYPKGHIQNWLIWVDILCCVGLFVAQVALTSMELPLNVQAASACLNHPCTSTRFHYRFGLFLYTAQGLANLVLGVLFFVLLRQNANKNWAQSTGTAAAKINNLRNRITVMTIVFEIVFKITPSLASFLMNTFTTVPLFNYVGWIVMLLSSVDACAIGLYYSVKLVNPEKPKAPAKTVHIASNWN